MIRRTAFLFCCAVLFLAATAAHASARRNPTAHVGAPLSCIPAPSSNLYWIAIQAPTPKVAQQKATDGGDGSLNEGPIEQGWLVCSGMCLNNCFRSCQSAREQCDWNCSLGESRCCSRICGGCLNGNPTCTENCWASADFCHDGCADAQDQCENDCYGPTCCTPVY